ncbi:MAG: carboxypeptidase-like regulatory domain-containing protein, partial [Thermodesulfobacteriota bacterium]|nr:carboxypeptidase-like regulatory domain-containing protein [Thermodesulfobacteriota bacterium]
EKKKANYEAYHWFGDPAMAIRTTAPVQIAVLHPPTWPWVLYPKDLTVNVTLNNGDLYQGPLEKATVTVTKEDSPSDYWVGKTDEEGNVTFPDLVATSLGDYEVVVTAYDTVTYAGTFQSETGPGAVFLNREVYGCPAEVRIKVADSALAHLDALEQEITATGGDREWVRLEATPAGSGFFVGAISAVSPPPVVPYDGALQVSSGETISVAHADQEDLAMVDCDPPAFEGLAVAQRNARRRCVELQWAEAYDNHGPVLYNIYRYHGDSHVAELIGSTWSESYADFDAAPGQTYYYQVRAQDTVGNEDDNEVQHEVKGTPLTPVYLLLLLDSGRRGGMWR